MKMKNTISLLWIALGCSLLFSCNKPRTNEIEFGGMVVNSKGKALDSVEVELQGTIVNTSKTGEFRIKSSGKSSSYVLNFSRKKYGFVSKVYTDSKLNLIVTMAKATEVSIDLRTFDGEVIRVADTAPETTPPPAVNQQSADALASVPFVYDEHGTLIDFKMPTALAAGGQGLGNFARPVRGAVVEIPKAGIDLPGENTRIDVSIQTIDTYSPDGMPGNNQVNLGGCVGYMNSFGAVNIELKQNGKPLNLRKGFKARVIVPVDTISILTGKAIAETIPFLTYNRVTGLWELNGYAQLNKSKSAYEGMTEHFSSFNMDMVIGTGASCYQICNKLNATTYTDQKIEVSAPYYHFYNLGAGDCECSTGGDAHVIINMGPYTPCGVRVFNGTTLLSTFVFIAGPPAASGACPYNGCGASVEINDTFRQEYVNSNKLGMCHAQLAFPQRTSTGSAASYPIKLTWLYEASFAAATVNESFEIQDSTNGTTWTSLATITSPNELVHEFVPPAIAPGAIHFYKVIKGGDSNMVCITVDTFGTVSYDPGGVTLTVPADCF